MENILLNPDRVTIDRWHLRALFGAGVEGTPTPKIYDQLARLTIQEAEKVGLKGLRVPGDNLGENTNNLKTKDHGFRNSKQLL